MKRSHSEWNSLISSLKVTILLRIGLDRGKMFTLSLPPSPCRFVANNDVDLCRSDICISSTTSVTIRVRVSKYEKNIAKRIDLETLTRKIVDSIGERDPWNFERNERRRYRVRFVPVPSRIQRDSTGKKKKEEAGGGRGEKKENRNKRKRRKRSPRETDGF